MKCSRVKEWLTEHVTAAGIEPTGEVKEHLNTCRQCREYCEELRELSAVLSPLEEISLTADESAEVERAVSAAIDGESRWSTSLKPEKNIYTIARAAAAVAAMVLIVLISSHQRTTDEETQTYRIEDLDLRYTSTDDLAPLFVNGETDYLPSLVDDEKAAYLTDRVYPAEAEEIFESATTEEIEWLMENYSLEI